jgi:iron complex outermembrane receptor protein
MDKHKGAHLLALAVTSVAATAGQLVIAQESASLNIEEVVTVGSRNNEPRSVVDSPVPVDVFSEEELAAFGNQADITDTLKALVPSYTATYCDTGHR